jgi:hypothetical protein
MKLAAAEKAMAVSAGPVRVGAETPRSRGEPLTVLLRTGHILAGLYSLVATCESRGINPFDYLTDVLARLQDHPAKAIDELLPAAWAAAR